MAAVLSLGREASAEQAAEILYRMVVGREDLQVQGETEEVSLVRQILSANIRVSVTHESGHIPAERSVAAVVFPLLIQRRSLSPASEIVDARDLIQAKGLNVVRRHGREGVFLVHDVVRPELLSGTRWSKSRIDQILCRVSGAERCQERCGGQRPWGIWLPFDGCLDVLLGQDTEQDNINEEAVRV